MPTVSLRKHFKIYTSLHLRPEVCYIIKYPHPKINEDNEEMWVIRQMGVYQQYCKKTGKAVWVLLNCGPNTKAQLALKNMLSNPDQAKVAWKNPAVLHMVVSACYLSLWRRYMSGFENELLKEVS